jgi:hypothetical protein
VADLVAFARIHNFIVSNGKVFLQSLIPNFKNRTSKFSKNFLLLQNKLSSKERFELPNLTRWFDFIQNTAASESGPKSGLNAVEIDLEAPKVF